MSTGSVGTTVISFQADERVKAELERVARATDRSVSAVIRQAIREYLKDAA